MHKNRQGTGLLIIGIAAAMGAGCAHHDTIVGAWAGASTTNQGQPQQFNLVFGADGRETMTMQATEGRQPINLNASGNYQISGDTLTQTWTKIQMNGQSLPATAGMVQTETYRYALQGNTLTLNKQGTPTPLVLTRQGS